MKQVFRLVHLVARRNAEAAVRSAPDGWIVTVDEPNKSRPQEERYHAMIGDIAKQCEFMGSKWSVEDWKRLLIDAFAKYKRELGESLSQGGRVVPSLDGDGIVQLGIQSRKFKKNEAKDFIEFLGAFGAERGVEWSEKETTE